MTSILVQVVGMPATARKVESISTARKRALELAKRYPSHWVDASSEDGQLIHLIEPRSAIIDDEAPEAPAPVLPDQEPMF